MYAIKIMNWSDLLKCLPDRLPRESVDCFNCSSTYKCCTYRPFIPNFLAGSYLELCKDDHTLLKNLELEWDYLPVGLAPNMRYRKKFEKEKGWGFGENLGLLCSFYDQAQGACRAWHSRPGVCRSFFCVSDLGIKGIEKWGAVSDGFWELEWWLLEQVCSEQGWTQGEMSVLKEWLSLPYEKGKRPPPKEYTYETYLEAMSKYREAAVIASALEIPRAYTDKIHFK